MHNAYQCHKCQDFLLNKYSLFFCLFAYHFKLTNVIDFFIDFRLKTIENYKD